MKVIEEQRQTSITAASSYQQQGLEYLQKAGPLSLDGLLAPFTPLHAADLAATLAADVHTAQHSSAEGPVQKVMLALTQRVSELKPLAGRQYCDTSETGLPILPPGRRAKPDSAGCEGHPCASSVSVINEAKPTLATLKHDGEATYQVVQRALQLQSSQPARTKWIFASMGNDSVRIFHIETANKV